MNVPTESRTVFFDNNDWSSSSSSLSLRPVRPFVFVASPKPIYSRILLLIQGATTDTGIDHTRPTQQQWPEQCESVLPSRHVTTNVMSKDANNKKRVCHGTVETPQQPTTYGDDDKERKDKTTKEGWIGRFDAVNGNERQIGTCSSDRGARLQYDALFVFACEVALRCVDGGKSHPLKRIAGRRTDPH